MNLNQPHRRYNPLKDEWILVSPQRSMRPWQGQTEVVSEKKRPTYDPSCYLCPGNIRASGEKTPTYTNTYVFENDFPALISGGEASSPTGIDLFQTESVEGVCNVVCFSPRHDQTLADMSIEQIETVISTWTDKIKELQKEYQWVQVFENKGAMMGCSNPHPHGQIWASNFIPNELSKEERQQKKYFEKHNTSMLVGYVHEELEKKERVIVENTDWVVIVPYWAVWPFETLLLPKRHIASFTGISIEEQHSLASIMKQLLVAYDQLFGISMPYSMGWHFAPTYEDGKDYWQLHAHFYPPLLRSAAVKKFMVGYELLSEAQRDITAEQAAKQLKRKIS